MATSTAPNLVPLYASYLAAFNAHSWPDIERYVSADCHGTARGKWITSSRAEMWPHYEKDFLRCGKHDVSIKEIKQVHRGPKEGDEDWMKGIEWGLYLVLWDPEMERTLWLNYWYKQESVKGEVRWMHVWHELLDVVIQSADK